ncbi:LamG-like jellyroll fold domain-containing protein [Elizabethkingia sp. M8]|uniref:LamG-like jellyroll fold domain-containing protein n=1 Tax=Elizabethkingia sp. M8 TaxID=2796140 RepID=UPI0019075D56|nr:LamG-like jellyroll fold domain-containing protein [Elizabethkingia sp. M8]QQM25271.1 hypothetical protein JCR23_10160 [Elizabethkingia sp. M8]
MYTFRIFPIPSDATVIINGLPQNEITTRGDELITWEVSKTGYVKKSGSFTITTNVDYNIELIPTPILNIPFNNNFNELTGNNSVIAGGTANFPTFVTGRRGTDFAASFNGSQSVKTSSNVLINGDKLSVSFWMKTTQTSTAIIADLSNNTWQVPHNTVKTFTIGINENTPTWGGVGRLFSTHTEVIDGRNPIFTNININDGNWRHFVITIDRALHSVIESKIYINGIISEEKLAASETEGDFINDILCIGQQHNNILGFNGQIQDFKLFDFILSIEDIERLYRE